MFLSVDDSMPFSVNIVVDAEDEKYTLKVQLKADKKLDFALIGKYWHLVKYFVLRGAVRCQNIMVSCCTCYDISQRHAYLQAERVIMEMHTHNCEFMLEDVQSTIK